jgi:hypothetical protein
VLFDSRLSGVRRVTVDFAGDAFIRFDCSHGANCSVM